MKWQQLEFFVHKSGSRECGQMWQAIATHLNTFEDFGISSRAPRDRFMTIMKKYKSQTNADLKRSGLGGEELGEFDNLMEDLISLSNESDLKQDTETESKKIANDLEQKKALDIRQVAMERLSETKKRVEMEGDDSESPKVKKSRRSTTDTMEFLREKLALDKEIQAKKMVDQKKEREFQRAQQQQSTDMLKTFQGNFQQQAQQQNVMQQNMMTMMNNQYN